MGVLVKYKFENMSAEDLVLIGVALDALPHGKVSGLVARMQAQISTQDRAAQEVTAAEQAKAVEAWRSGEREKLKAEVVPQPPAKSTRKRS
jgi:hypothetical protein